MDQCGRTRRCSRSTCRAVSIPIPGVCWAAPSAQHTITFIALKPGLLTLDGPDHSGTLHLAALGLDAPLCWCREVRS